jgi:L,D-transpeptidase catalytic domain
MDDDSDQMNGPTHKRSFGRSRWLAVFVAVLVPLIPIVIGLSLSGGGSTTAVDTPTVASHFSPVGTAPKPARTGLALPGGSGALVALVRHPTAMRSGPGGHVVAKLSTRTQFGSPAAVWVARVSGRWLGVVSPQAGNNHLGWIPAADASLSRVDWELNVSLSARRLTVMRDGRVLQRYTIAVGAPANPTPAGRFAVTDRLRTGDPAGPYGCCILALSALAPHAIQDWSGGNRIAIHSTPETSSIGEPVSHGCMRLTLAEGRWLMDHVPLGTPTIIRA